MKKPQLAEDAILARIKFPCWEQPKIDGVRAMKPGQVLVGRSLDPFKGYAITDYFSQDMFDGLDGEMILGDNPACTDRLCSNTTGAMGRFKGVSEMPDLTWWVFDLINHETTDLPYAQRYEKLADRVAKLNHPRIKLVPYTICYELGHLTAAIARNAAAGFEGTITRNPDATIKEGRASALRGQEVLRFKPWSDFEILVTGITEGSENHNEKKTNSLGRSERSSAQAGQIPNGQVGSIQGTMAADFFNPLDGKLLFAKGLEVTAGSGEMSVVEATYYFQNQSELIGNLAKIKTMTHGVKDLPRFPTFVSIRMVEDVAA